MRISVSLLRDLLEEVTDYLPQLITGLLILLIGLIISWIIHRLVQQFLKAIHFDKMAEKIGVDKIWTHAGIKTTASRILSGLVFWLAIIIVLVMTVDQLGLKDARDVLISLINYIPVVIAAVFVLIIGMFFSVFVSGIVTTAASNARIPQAKLMGSISQIAIIVSAFVIALDKLEIKTDLITNLFTILFGAVCLALAIAFGLGCKDLAAKYAAELVKKKPPLKKSPSE